MASLSDAMLIIIGILIASDVAFLIAVLTVDERIRTLIKKKESELLLQNENPIQWLKHTVNFSALSILSGIAYGFMISGLTIGLSIGNLENILLIPAMFFFLLSLLYIVRVAHFIFNPASKANIITGKAIKKIIKLLNITVRIIMYPLFTVLNVYLLILAIQPEITGQDFRVTIIIYAVTVVLSIIATPILMYELTLHPDKETSKRDLIAMLCFFSPWIVFIILAVVVAQGIPLI